LVFNTEATEDAQRTQNLRAVFFYIESR